MAEGRITPEKQLLNLIEGSKKENEKPVEHIDKEAFRRKVNSYFSFGAALGRISFFKDWIKSAFKGGKFYVDIKSLNKILTFGIFILAFYFMFNFLTSIMNSEKISSLELSVASAAGAPFNLPEVSSLKPASHYLEEAKSRNIFALVADLPQKEDEQKRINAKLSEMLQNLKLVGISWSDDPDIIIEDTKLQQAYFLKKGQKVGDFTIKAVYKDRVILSYGGQEIELR
ncbi:MAG: hypothetical protein A3K83_03060 [Omnitrophica WOR_2 bacterium RBG_13_44_8b]|nr:MAG: hypothetical protein A3K83_03060 [Omnitrophica WOR_2 bacterium RBG_13_44_8b]